MLSTVVVTQSISHSRFWPQRTCKLLHQTHPGERRRTWAHTAWGGQSCLKWADIPGGLLYINSAVTITTLVEAVCWRSAPNHAHRVRDTQTEPSRCEPNRMRLYNADRTLVPRILTIPPVHSLLFPVTMLPQYSACSVIQCFSLFVGLFSNLFDGRAKHQSWVSILTWNEKCLGTWIPKNK